MNYYRDKIKKKLMKLNLKNKNTTNQMIYYSNVTLIYFLNTYKFLLHNLDLLFNIEIKKEKGK